MKSILIIGAIIFGLKAFAHGDHSAPGALPSPPHGGVLGEAKHEHKGSHKGHDHHEAEEREIFFEIVKKGESLKIYPLMINPKNHKEFLEIKARKFTDVNLIAHNPRKKKNHKLEFISTLKYWATNLKKIRGRRFLIKITGIYHGAKYKASIQIEKK